MEMSEAWPDTFNERYIHQLQPELTHKMEHFSNDHEDCHNQHKNSCKQCDEIWHPVMNIMESKWKLRQQHDQNFPMNGKPL